mgnify:CR=1 FL=1
MATAPGSASSLIPHGMRSSTFGEQGWNHQNLALRLIEC